MHYYRAFSFLSSLEDRVYVGYKNRCFSFYFAKQLLSWELKLKWLYVEHKQGRVVSLFPQSALKILQLVMGLHCVCLMNLSTTLQFPYYIFRNNRTDRDVVRFVCVTNWSEFSLSCLITFILFFLNSVDFINFWIRFLSSIPPILNYKLVEVCHIAFVLANRNAQI